MTHKALPASVEAEQSVLGALLLDPNAFAAAQPLHASDFSDAAHGEIYAAIAAQIETGQSPDLITVFETLRANGRTDIHDRLPYLNQLSQCVPSANNIARHAAIVRESSLTDLGGVTIVWDGDTWRRLNGAAA